MAQLMGKYLKLLLLLACVYHECVGEMVAKCPPYYIQRGGTNDCYLFHGWSKRTWNDAQAYCDAENGNLVNIGSKDMAEWIALQIVASGLVGDSSEFWIDAKYSDNSSTWYWVNTGQPVNLEYLPEDPRPRDGLYGVITIDTTLLGHPPDDEYHFICHREISEPMYCDVEDGWRYTMDRCYKTSDSSTTWLDGEAQCRDVSGHLITIHDFQEQNFVFDEGVRQHDNVWIGITELGHEGNFTWIGESSSFLLWNENLSMPVSMNGYASGVVDHEVSPGKWVTEDSRNDNHFICQREKGACVMGWQLYGDSCYYFNRQDDDIVTWDTAYDLCAGVGAHLAIIETADEDGFLHSSFSGGEYLWLGLYLNKSDEGFMWIDGTPYSRNYTKMSEEDEASAIAAGDRKCVYARLTESGEETWTPVVCTDTHKHVCEVDKSTPVHIPPAPLNQYCPEGWTLYQDFCYYASQEEMSWTAAENQCSNQGGHLASVTSWPEQDYIHTHVLSSSWIGLNDRKEDGSYQWNDGKIVTIVNWNTGEPSGGSENCVELLAEGGYWNDLGCSALKTFVCKRAYSTTPLAPVTTTTPAPDSTNCGYGWEEDTTTGVCYRFFAEHMTFADARLHCQEQHYVEGQSQPDLASISTEQDQIFVQGVIARAQVQDHSIFVGLSNDVDGLYWRDGDPVGILNYADGEPNGYYYEYCTEIYNDGFYKWNDGYCENRLAFVCEKKGLAYRAPTIPATTSECPTGWKKFNDDCYYISSGTELTNWDAARKMCTYMYGSKLTSIYSQEENQFIYDSFANELTSVWIGLRADDTGNLTTWLDGGSVQYSNWYPGEPNDWAGHEKCGEMYILSSNGDGAGQWNDKPCESTERYACKTLIKTCPEGWSYKEGKCYYASTSWETWHNAIAKCKEIEGEATLVSWHSQDEVDYVQSLLDDEVGNTWVGLTRDASGGDWYWSDGSATDFINWRPGQPDHNDTELCALTSSVPDSAGYGMLDNYPCNESYYYACEFFPNSIFCFIDNYPCNESYYYACEFFPTHRVTCDEGWSRYHGHCYGSSDVLFPGVHFTFQDARKQCQALDGDLASIWSIQENDFVYSLIPENTEDHFLIGLQGLGTDGPLTWSDGTDTIYSNLAMISKEDPLDCYSLTSQSGPKWVGTSCAGANYFICKKAETITSLTPPSSGCKNVDDHYQDRGTSCYTEVATARTYKDAKADCETSYGAHLVSIHDAVENAFVSAIYGHLGDKIWIGLQEKINSDGTVKFQWDDGTEFAYDNWGEYEPYADYGECSYASGSGATLGLWYIDDCVRSHPYVCEYERTGFTTVKPPVTTPAPAYCAPGFTIYLSTQSCYKVFAGDLKPEGLAEQSCQQYGAHLVSFHSEQEETFVRKLPDFSAMNTSSFWSGLRVTSEQGYQWLDGSATDYLNWANNQPDSHLEREECVNVNIDNSKWSDTYCDGYLPYVCKAPQGMTIMTTPAPITSAPDVPCPDFPDDPVWVANGAHCYGIYSKTEAQTLAWVEARKECQRKKAELVSILDVQENSFVVSKVYKHSDTSMWTGGHADYGGGFYWADGQPFDFQNWAVGEPNNYYSQESCVSLYPHNFGYWNDDNCGNAHGFICKKPIGATAPPYTTAAPPAGHCHQGWVHVAGKCIKLVNETVKFDDAQKACRESGVNSNLVSIHGSQMQAVITLLMTTTDEPAWIGLRSQSNYKWTDETPVNYANWGPLEPSGGISDPCVETMPDSGFWTAIDCAQNRSYICAQNPDPELSTDSPPPKCASPYENFISFEDSCYKLVLDPKTWQEAEDYCISQGAHLTSVERITENSLIFAMAAGYGEENLWMGLNSNKKADQYLWVDGFPVLYTNWGPREPNVSNTDNRCVMISSTADGTWYSRPCDQLQPFVCKHSEGFIPTPDPPSDGNCPNPHWLDFGGGYCYLVVTDVTKTWNEANLGCIEEGGNLVSIHSQTESDLISKATATYQHNLWCGLIQRDTSYAWSDGSALDYLHWDEGEPNSQDEICVEMYYYNERVWNDKDCNNQRGYVCKAPKIGGEGLPPSSVQPGVTTKKPVNKNGLSGGAVTGIVIGSLLLVAVVGVVGYSYRNRLPAPSALPSFLTRSSARGAAGASSSDDFVTLADGEEQQSKA
ncbi:macrophage mannose receptor 1 [Hyalella azteca]|uniref:Macrophage mannose receptor 1 n=1 Tax=Hyalella azteca TaxID=294128 RepID=A0A8B7NEY9_HYAAZ|nr:macrophage mannose receptor 1 [Hyalella azteca]